MNSRNPRSAPKRAPVQPMHRGPQAMTPASATPAPVYASAFHHAPNAALLIDFDNVTMGIRSDLGHELRSLLGSDIIKGKVAVQRAYADWRRYPQYIVPLSESSIDLIFAPAYGSSKKNATDIRLAIDALELVFTRPEIGTFILLSGDSDFSSLVIKLKEYGKYVIGVGIRESSSDLLVQNCDEYYSYNALAGLVKSSEDEGGEKMDPWSLVTVAMSRMKKNGDVMRSDRLKQVMQEIDASFDEKDLGFSKFSRFCQEAATRGLLAVTRLDNGQLEVDLPSAAGAAPRLVPERSERPERPESEGAEGGEAAPEGERVRRGRRGRGRGRDRGERGDRAERPAVAAVEPPAEPRIDAPADRTRERPGAREPERDGDAIGVSGERLTRDEAFGLVRRAVEALTTGDDDSSRASQVRVTSRELLGRDSESLSERNFTRILRDAHDANVIDLRRRGDDFEVARAARAEPVADQLARAEPTITAPPAPPAPRGMGNRGIGMRGFNRGRAAEPPPNLFAVGVVESAQPSRIAEQAQGDGAPAPEVTSDVADTTGDEIEVTVRAAGRKRGARKTAAKKGATPVAKSRARAKKATLAEGAPRVRGRKPAGKPAAAE